MSSRNEVNLTDVGSISEAVSTNVDEVENETKQAFELYEEIIDRAEEGVPEHVEWDYDAQDVTLDQIGVDDASVEVSSRAEQELHDIESPETVSFESESVAEYIDDITSRIDEVETVKGELDSRIESAEEISNQAFSDFVDSTQLLETYDNPSSALEGSWGEKLQQHLTAKE
ncbi:MAG: hypothetical protein BRC26_01770, partial [Nanohaloarchaea archaeon QH_8_44_6]